MEMACPSLAPPPAVTVCLLDRDLGERGRREAHDHARHAFVAHQDVRAAAQQAHRRLRLVATAHQLCQLVDRLRLGEVLGRAAQVKPGVRRQRLSPLYELFESLVQAHGQSFRCLRLPA